MKHYEFIRYHGYSAQKLLDALSKEYSLSMSPPVDVDKIARCLGVRIDEELDMDELNVTGKLSLNNSSPKIWLNPLDNSYEPRRRFTLAHEIGHLILHIDPDSGVKEFIDTEKTMNRSESYWDVKEYEANSFAAQLLMPLVLLKKHGREVIDSYKERHGVSKVPVDGFIKEMAELFSVSVPAMKYRLKNLSIIK